LLDIGYKIGLVYDLIPLGNVFGMYFIFFYETCFLNLSSHIFTSFLNDVETYSCCCVLTNQPYV
jgi:hypothetical protein